MDESRLIDDVWEGKIDHMTTGKIAQQYGITQNKALRILKKIASGYNAKYPYNKHPFVYDQISEGVIISDGSLWTYSPMNIDGDSAGGKGPKHYVWFCS